MVINDNLKIPYSNIKVMMNEYIRGKGQQRWKSNSQNNYFQIKFNLETDKAK